MFEQKSAGFWVYLEYSGVAGRRQETAQNRVAAGSQLYFSADHRYRDTVTSPCPSASLPYCLITPLDNGVWTVVTFIPIKSVRAIILMMIVLVTVQLL